MKKVRLRVSRAAEIERPSEIAGDAGVSDAAGIERNASRVLGWG